MKIRPILTLTMISVLASSATTAYAIEPPDSPTELSAALADAVATTDTDQNLLDDIFVDESGVWGDEYQQDVKQATGIDLSESSDSFTYVESGAEQIGIRPLVETPADWTTDTTGVATLGGDSYDVVRVAKEDGTLQYASILGSAGAPESYAYALDLPEGAYAEKIGEGILVFDSAKELLGGFTPPWAKDASGKDLPTSYEIVGGTLVQHVSHQNLEDVTYPVVADPAYAGGMISRVNHEYWASGGWIVQIEVTALARYTWTYNPSLVAQKGYNDLLQHHPRSMSIPTMAQQWDCHVLGLLGTFKIDLESYRSSKPNWRNTGVWNAVMHAVSVRDPRAVAVACNW